MRTGDVVRHKPSGETWVVAYADSYDVICCGWPETIARPEECELIEACSDEEYWKLVERVSHISGLRGSRCAQLLQERNTPLQTTPCSGADNPSGRHDFTFDGQCIFCSKRKTAADYDLAEAESAVAIPPHFA